MRSLAGSNSSPHTDTAHQYKEDKGSRNSMDTSNKNHLLVNEKGDVGMAKCFYKEYGHKG